MKLVSELGVGTVAAGVAKARADAVLISGYDGGTGAAPLSSIQHAGAPWELGLAETQQTLVLNNLRGCIRVLVDGQLKTGRDVAIGALLGAEEFGFATAPLVVLGCLMMRKCHQNTCPVGVATQDPALRKLFKGRPEYLVNFFRFIALELREIMAQLGLRTLDEMVGRSDLLEMNDAISFNKARGLDYSRILFRPESDGPFHCTKAQNHGLEDALDRQLLPQVLPAIEARRPVELSSPIRNVHRTVGTMIAGEIARRYGHAGLPDDTVTLRFQGTAGQSFGAWAAKGLTLVLEGEANDYVGKGLSGGRIVIKAPAGSDYDPAANIIAGNVLLYGASCGECYICGAVGERFAIRNSGAWAVVEGVGDHACEYMTGGRVVVLGDTGRNMAAGMSGGIAFVLGLDPAKVNPEMVELQHLEPEDLTWLHDVVARHAQFTDSTVARSLLSDWPRRSAEFTKVMPTDYQRVLQATRMAKAEGRDVDTAIMEASRG